jgi:1-acyl-sn-glycerol-3-phosphate acyltransferase
MKFNRKILASIIIACVLMSLVSVGIGVALNSDFFFGDGARSGKTWLWFANIIPTVLTGVIFLCLFFFCEMWLWWIIKYSIFIPVYFVLFPTRFINKRELRKYNGQGVIYVCNHRSAGDPFVIFMRVHRRIALLGKESLFKHWLWGRCAYSLGCYPVKKGGELGLMRFSLDRLKKKQALLIFPEGTRVFNAEDGVSLRNGASMIAIRAGVPIIPMVYSRAPNFFRRNKLKVGTAIQTMEYAGRASDKEALNELSNKIRESMTNLLHGFERAEKPKWYDLRPVNIARSITIVDQTQLIVIRRNKNGEEYYVLPGGHVDEGENPRDTAARETLEETNATVTTSRLLYKTLFNDKRSGEECMQNFYLCQYKGGEIKPTNAEEYTQSEDSDRGTYKPMLLPIDQIASVDLRPVQIRDQLVRDIAKKGTILARKTIYVKSNKS